MAGEDNLGPPVPNARKPNLARPASREQPMYIANVSLRR